MHEEYTIGCEDGVKLAARRFEASGDKGVVIIAPALGVKQSFYGRFAQFLADSGYTAISFDYRGTGGSRHQNEADIALQEWGSKDLESVIVYALKAGLPVTVVGHSIGGQLIGLAPSGRKLSGSLLIAASAPYWRRWKGTQKLKMCFAVHVLFPLVTSLKSRFSAATFGLGNQDLPSGCVRTWAKWMTKPDYFLDPSFGLRQDAFAAIGHDMVFWGFSDDDLAPKENIEHLMRFYPNAVSQIDSLSPASAGVKSIGHTGFFRDQCRDNLWQQAVASIGAMSNNGDTNQSD